MAVPTLTANSPSSGFIAWTAFNIQYNGVSYSVAASNTNSTYTAWLYNGGSPVLVFNNNAPILSGTADGTTTQWSGSSPVLGPDDLLLFVNRSGVPINVQAAQLVDGDLIVPGTITSGNIATGTIVANNIASGTITATQIATDTLTASQIAANAITSSELSTSAVTADKIAAGAITTSKLSVGSLSDNHILNSTFEDVDSGGALTSWRNNFLGGTATVGNSTSTFIDGARSGLVSPTATLSGDLTSNAFPVVAGQTLYIVGYAAVGTANIPIGVTCTFGATAAYTTGSLVAATPTVQNISLIRIDTGAAISLPSATTSAGRANFFGGGVAIAATSVIHMYQVQVVVPTGASWASISLQGFSGVAGNVYWDDIECDSVIVSAVIGNGQITATQVATDTLTANNIAANAITSSELSSSSVIADKIAAGAITAEKLTIGSLGDNIIKNSGMEDASQANGALPANWASGWETATGPPTYLWSAGIVGSKSLGITNSATTGGAWASDSFPVTPGQNLVISALLMASAASVTNAYVRIFYGTTQAFTRSSGLITGTPASPTNVQWLNTGTGAVTASTGGGGVGYAEVFGGWAIPTTNVVQVSGVSVVPATAAWARVALYNWQGTTSTVYFDEVNVNDLILSARIANGSITANNIQANTITSGQIAANTINTGQLNANAINGMTISSNTINSANINSSTINSANVYGGNIATRSGLSSGNGLMGVSIDAAAFLDRILFFSGASSETSPGSILVNGGVNPSVQIAAPNITIGGTTYLGAYIQCANNTSVAGNGIIYGYADDHIELHATNGLNVFGTGVHDNNQRVYSASNPPNVGNVNTGTFPSGNVAFQGWIHSGSGDGTNQVGASNIRWANGFFMNITNYAGSTSGTTCIFSSGNLLARSSSSRRFKTNIRDHEDLRWDILDLKPVTYHMKGDLHAGFTGEYMREVGLIAEDVHEAGFPDLIQYEVPHKIVKEGEHTEHGWPEVELTGEPILPESVKYDRIAVLLLPIIKDLRDRVVALEKRK